MRCVQRASNTSNVCARIFFLEFTWKRVASRGGVMLVILFCGLSVPQFGGILE